MRKRMEDIGGTFAINPCAERGTRVRLTAPLGSGKIRATNEQ
jgi:signal transduction histidine kinase